MRIYLFLMILASTSLLLPTPVNAQEFKCKASRPQIAVKTATTNTKIIRTKSSGALQNLHGGGSSSGKSRVGGLGGGPVGFKTRNEFEISSQGNKACVRLKRVEVTFFAQPEIHIASNFARASCEHHAVMAHEQGHIRILRKFMREYTPRVKNHIQGLSRQINPVIGPVKKSQITAAQQQLQNQFLSSVNRYQKQIMPELKRRQKAHDNPQEYARVAAQCNKWDQKLSQDPPAKRGRYSDRYRRN